MSEPAEDRAMHECPDCGQVCDCIGDDTWDSSESAYCCHECDESNEECFQEGQEDAFE